MTLIAVLATIALISVLTVATLSLSGRLAQESAAMASDAELESMATSAVADVMRDWRSLKIAQLSVGSTTTIHGSVGAATATTTVTRIGSQLFWIVADVARTDGAVRRQNLIVRLRIPSTDSLPAFVVSGDATVSSRFLISHDSAAGCASEGPDVVAGTNSRITSGDGGLAAMEIVRIANPDSAASAVGATTLDSLIDRAEVELAGGTSSATPTGVVHVAGDLTITGGAGSGILVVDGMLQVVSPIQYVGIILARGGLRITADGSSIEGSLRAIGPSPLEIAGSTSIRRSRCSSKVIINQSLTPRLVAGRRWAEMY